MSSLPELGKSVIKCQPFVSALHRKEKSYLCDNCFNRIIQSFECKTCSEFWYCSESCRETDYEYHKYECNQNIREFVSNKCKDPLISEQTDWKKFSDLDEYITHTQILIRILLKLKFDPNCAAKPYQLPNGLTVSYNDIKAAECESMHRVYHELEDESVETELIDEMSYNFGAWLSVVRQIIESEPMKSHLGSLPKQVLLRAYRIVVMNTLYITDTTFLKTVGKGIYIEMCFISHSCIPNCVPLFDGNNFLELHLIDPNVNQFSDLRYDYQIEMAGLSAETLRDNLQMRNISCDCKRCLSKNMCSENVAKKLTEANLTYGNWPKDDYCRYMKTPLKDLVFNFTDIYGDYHPWVTALLLSKFRVEIVLFDLNDYNCLKKNQLFNELKKIQRAVCVTHGSNHVWIQKLSIIEDHFKRIDDRNSYLEYPMETDGQTVDEIRIIEKIFDEIIPIHMISGKLI